MLNSRFSASSQRCPHCGRSAKPCGCPAPAVKTSSEKPKWTVVLRIEKGNRGGKTVTVIEGFPRNSTLLEQLCREFKTRLGAGGTFGTGEKGGFIEIQGEQRDRVRELLRAKQIGFKG